MSDPIRFDVRVLDRGGAYGTNTVQGKRASCTHSAQAAVQSLAHKLVTDRPVRVLEQPTTEPIHGLTLWRIEA